MHKDIYIKDLENRFPDYDFTESRTGNLTTFEAANGGGTILSSTTRLSAEDAVCCVRKNLVGGAEVLPILTTVQIAALSDVCEGTNLFDSTAGRVKVCIDCSSNVWG